eukprot:CAMPEP_0119075886 /NCGR_PEP_ID=MMETSP1178-20130426/83452_1 /TAXON_ID=33656 /ORGANISM="unid sp, Strain CCMP2000" /LENGTH=93 /DNA_ID=CAMNT_0007058137 /DNA_START=245 /DNA_END=526 /DNA_ORIENTATION=+
MPEHRRHVGGTELHLVRHGDARSHRHFAVPLWAVQGNVMHEAHAARGEAPAQAELEPHVGPRRFQVERRAHLHAGRGVGDAGEQPGLPPLEPR